MQCDVALERLPMPSNYNAQRVTGSVACGMWQHGRLLCHYFWGWFRLWVFGLLSFAAVPFFGLAFSILALQLATCNGAYAH